jgi:DNA-binding winged helix-turn-helix (wHTH) protein
MSGWFNDGELKIDLRACRVWLGSREVNLSALRFKILCYLTGKAGQPVTPRELLRHAWPDEQYDAGLVRWHISRLRQDLNDMPPRRIVHVRGFGYRYDRLTPEEIVPSIAQDCDMKREIHSLPRIRRTHATSCKSRSIPRVVSSVAQPFYTLNGTSSHKIDVID